MPTILVVEDEDQVRVLAEGYLNENGYETVSAASLEEGLALLRDERQPIDLLFTDVRLKGNEHGGIELGGEAVKVRRNLRVLYTTGAGITDGMIKMFVDGYGFIPKPYTTDDLINGVKNLLASASN